MQILRDSTLSLAIASVLLLSACGSGGGTKPDPTPATPPTTPPPTSGGKPVPNHDPIGDKAFEFCTADDALNKGAAGECIHSNVSYGGRVDNQIVGSSAHQAHAMGYDGTPVKVGVLDDQQVAYSVLDGKVDHYRDYTNTGKDDAHDKKGHGAVMGAIIAGQPGANNFKGGVAPGSSLYWARICENDNCRSDWARDAIEDLAKRGVRLFNASIAGHADDLDTARLIPVYVRDYGYLIQSYDALLVAAAGNDSHPHAGWPAVLPAHDARFASNIIAAVNIKLDATGKPDGLHETSNGCGIAFKWCLSAPGSVTIAPVPGTQWQSGATGTSNAAAIITGAAAMVWQAFPWMSASNVQQTLLTTATDIGQPGLDNVYGWGLVNAGKAVRGPGQFIGNFTASVTPNHSAWFLNDISGAGGLIKRGEGDLMLTGNNTYTGATAIHSGTLGLSGRLASAVTVESGGRFQSYGGQVARYTARAGSTTAIQVGTGLTVDGNATLDGTLRLIAPVTGYAVKDKEKLIGAGSISGTFSNITYGSGLYYSATLDYQPTTVTANMVRTSTAASAASASLSDAAIEVGGRLDAATGNALPPGGLAGGIARLDSTYDLAAAQIELESLAGQIHSTARSMGVHAALSQSDLLSMRTWDQANWQEGTWVQFGGADRFADQGRFAGAQISTNGLSVGIDRRLSANSVAGVAMMHESGQGGVGGLGGTLQSQGTGVFAYGTTQLVDGKVLLGASAGTHLIDTQTRRTLLAGGQASHVSTDRDESVQVMRVDASLQSGSLAPYASVMAVRYAQGAFTEAGADGLGMTVKAQSQTATLAEVGARYSHHLGRQCRAIGSLSMRQVVGGGLDYTAAFTGAAHNAFQIAAVGMPTRVQVLGLDAACQVGRNVQAFGHFNATFTGDRSQQTQGMVGLRLAF